MTNVLALDASDELTAFFRRFMRSHAEGRTVAIDRPGADNGVRCRYGAEGRENAMDPMEAARGRAFVAQPEEGRSWWQPMPASGHADPKLVPSETGFAAVSMGYQTIARGGRIRPHSHRAQVELQICFRGRGRVVVDGESHPLVPGTACFLGPDVRHEIVNESDDDLVMMWVITPAGVEDFFAAVGRERTRGEPAPGPFERPPDVVAIERGLGMNDTTVDG